MSVAVGFTLQPDERYLGLLADVLRSEPEYYEIAPESCWRVDAAPRGAVPDERDPGELRPNAFSLTFEALARETGLPCVAHGVGFSVGSATPDPVRRARWLSAIARDHARFDFQWYTDHLGASVVDGRELTLPLGLPHTGEAAAAVRASLAELQRVVPDVGFENSTFYFHLGDPLDEPAWLQACLLAPQTHLLLDLHNVYTTALNVGFDPREYVRRLPLERVIEMHLSGGAWSEPGWLPSGRVMRLDSHDDAVPDEVWSLFEETLPRCPHLRGVTLERMEGTVEAPHVPLLREELRRIRRTLELAHVR